MDLLGGKEYFVGVYCPSRRFEVNHEKLFTPASNTKIFTSWFSLHALGEDHEFYSEYAVEGGTLYVRCRGNPLLSDSDIRWLTENADLPQNVERIVVDAGYLNAEARPPGWCFDDSSEGYAPVVHDVCFSLNRVEVVVRGGELSMNPRNTFFRVEVDKRLERPRVTGRRVVLPAARLSPTGRTSFSYPSPTRFLLEYIAETLRERGVAKDDVRLGVGRLRGRPYRFAKKSMGEVLRALNKRSENIIAELLLLHAGRKLGAHSLGGALKKMHEELGKRSIRGVHLFDGSGLSRYNLVSPSAVVRLLEQLQDSALFVDSLPVGSVDGTLSGRLDPRVRAKTGSLLGVRALSGYADGECFSIIVNHSEQADKAVALIDDFVLNHLLS